MPRRKRNAGDVDGRASSPQLDRAAGPRPTLVTSTTPRKSKRTRIISPRAIPSFDDALDDSTSSLDERPPSMLPPLPLVDAEPEPETEPESSIPPHIRRLIKGKQPQRHASSGSGFIDMTSHLYSPRLPPTDSDTDESSFWSTADTSMSSNTSALLSDTSMSVRMDVVRFDWPSSPKSGPAHPQPSDKTQKIHRAKSAPNMSPDRFIPRHSVQDDALLHRSTISTPRSIRLARHLGFVIGDGQPYVSSEGKFEERLRRARRQSNATSAEDETTPTEESVSFIRRAMAGAMVEREQSSAQSSTRIGSHSTRSLSPTLLRGRPSDHTGPNTPAAFSRDASPNPFHSTIHETSLASRPTLHHSISETSLNATTSRLSLDTENSYRVSSPEASFRSSTPASSGHFPEPSLRQLPHERALLLRAASTLITPSPHIPSDIAGIGASGAAMSWGMGVSITSMRGRTLTGIAAPSPSSRFHMQRAPIHVYDAPDILEDYYAAPFAWNYATSEQSFTQRASKNKQSTTDHASAPDSTSDSARDDHLPGGVLACALGMSVFFSRVSGSKLLQIEQLCSLEEGRGLQSTVEWGRPNGGCENSLAVGQTDGGLEIWDVPTRRMVNRLRAPTLLHLPDASFTPSQVFALSWNRNLLAAGLEGCGLLWDTRAPGGEKAAFRLSAHGKNKVCGMKWREDGEMLATGGDDRMVCVWDVRMPKKPVLTSGNGDGKFTSRRPMWKKKIHGAAVKALAWCPWAPNILASGGGKSDGTVCFWDAQTGTLKDTLQLGSQITSIYFSPVCREFVTTHGLRTSTARPTQPTEFQTFDPHADQTGPLPDTANSIVTHAYPSLARVAHVPNLHGMRISHASLSPDGSRLMTGGTFEALVMWSLWGAVAKQEEQGIGSFVDFATYSRHILADLNSYTPSLSSLYLYIVTAMVANSQAPFLTCRFHTAGINMTCIDCLVISGFALPTPPPYANPYAPFVPWTQPQTGPKPLGALNANNMFSSDEETYMHKMRFALQEMDSQFEFVPDGNFLDLGCCPGGFSTYVLSKWPNARGFGVSLPVEFGGHSLAVPMELRDRLEVHWADVTMFDLAPSLIHGFWDTTIFTPCPIPPRAFDFVMVDGHQPPCLSKDDPRAPWSRDRLLLSQLLAALRAINPWGTLLAKLSLQVSVPLMERIVLALSRLTPLPIRAIKPTSIYATAATFYILIQSPIPSLCDRLVRILEGLWYFMTFGGPNGFGRGLSESDMDLIATYPEILVAKQQLKFLFAPIEEVRRAAKFKAAPGVSA